MTTCFLQSLPQELLLDDLLPLLSLRDALSLFRTNKFFYKLGNDEVHWKRRLKKDFNFTNASNARTSGFKFLYSRLNTPKVFVWGESSEGRMGRPGPRGKRSWITDSKQYWPLEVAVPGGRVVELAAGGWSFSALDTNGHVYVWGQLQNGYGLARDGFAYSSKQATRPLRLGLPRPIQSISCGRNFSAALDCEGDVLCFNSWGRPFIYKPSIFDASHPGSRVVQVECGWSFSAALTDSGTVYVWNQFRGAVGSAFADKGEQLDRMQFESHRQDLRGDEIDGVIQCHVWVMEGIEPLRLPELPSLPKLKRDASHPKLVKIAAGDQFLVGLTDGGHVLKLNLTDINRDTSLTELANEFQQRLRGWEYMPRFCERGKISELEAFKPEGGIMLPETLTINHISARFLTFVAYSSGKNSIVLMGPNDANSQSDPRVISSLQNRGVISVVLGDYHYGALLENGKVLTWGSTACTGLGDPFEIEPGHPGGFRTLQDRERTRGAANLPDVREPTEVRFDHGLKKPRERFAFHLCAAGWHTGALVVDLEEGEPEEVEPVAEELPDPFIPPPVPWNRTAPPPGTIPPFIFRGGIFPPHRVGLAGAHTTRRHQQPPPGGPSSSGS